MSMDASIIIVAGYLSISAGVFAALFVHRRRSFHAGAEDFQIALDCSVLDDRCLELTG